MRDNEPIRKASSSSYTRFAFRLVRMSERSASAASRNAAWQRQGAQRELQPRRCVLAEALDRSAQNAPASRSTRLPDQNSRDRTDASASFAVSIQAFIECRSTQPATEGPAVLQNEDRVLHRHDRSGDWWPHAAHSAVSTVAISQLSPSSLTKHPPPSAQDAFATLAPLPNDDTEHRGLRPSRGVNRFRLSIVPRAGPRRCPSST